jgi:hypothetical protein
VGFLVLAGIAAVGSLTAVRRTRWPARWLGSSAPRCSWAITVVGLPFAIYNFIRWSLFAEVCVLEDRSARWSLRPSAELIRGHWWRTFGLTLFVGAALAPFSAVRGGWVWLLRPGRLDFE